MKKSYFKIAAASVAALATLTALSPAFSVAPKAQAAARVLNVMSWEDYIWDSNESSDPQPALIRNFEDYYYKKTGERVTVVYSTQGTCENMYTELKMNPNYDLLCPSEYMIMKMMSEGMLEKFDRTRQSKVKRDDGTNKIGVETYDKSVSPYISDVFKSLNINGESVYDYACCYMWGTMGYVYNPEFVSEENISHWSAVWNPEYKNKSTIKDSVRDSYILALGNAYSGELMALADEYKGGKLSAKDYNAKLTEIFNRVDEKSLEITGKDLKNLKNLLYGYEVDSGKKDMAAGKIWINFAWSGDAVYAMDFAEDPEEVGENTAELNYCVPVEGSNIFFDGWVMPKGADVELAQAFIDYIETPENAVLNMDFIGYTTSIATDEVLDYVMQTYGLYRGKPDEDGKTSTALTYYAEILDEEGEVVDYTLENCELTVKTDENGNETYFIFDGEDETEVYKVDLSYLFNTESGAVLYTDTLGRQFSAQYPDFETVTRCTVMGHMDNDKLERLNFMWAEAKEGNSDFMLLAVGIVVGVMILLVIGYVLVDRGVFDRHGKKGYKLVLSEEIK
ncbi:MAG: extracellular solute-binding protein [Candidatus Borkfalkiaceae bacterium]|nr:extracellular solute-binding protein [Christensenellaceae bacterium]